MTHFGISLFRLLKIAVGWIEFPCPTIISMVCHTGSGVGTTAGREIRGSHSALKSLPETCPCCRGAERRPLVGLASAQKRLAQPTESVSHHPISASRPSDTGIILRLSL